MQDEQIEAAEEDEAVVEDSRVEPENKELGEGETETAPSNETAPAVDERANKTALELADMDAIYPKNIPLSREQIRNGGFILYIISK